MSLSYKELLAIAATLLTFIGFLPYIRSIMIRKIKPHVFSWTIWGAGTLTVFFAQLSDGGGAGAWPIGASGVLTVLIAFLAYIKTASFKADRLDWLLFLLALAALPIWYATSDPLSAVIVLTLSELLAFVPTLRQASRRPHEESLLFFSLFAVRNALAIAALENYSLTTILFPAAAAAACILLIAVVAYKRTVR